MVNKILKQSFARHLYVSGFIWIMIPALFGIWWYFNFDTDFLMIAGIYQIFLILPAIYLHLSYTVVNYGQEIEISTETIIIRKNSTERVYKKTEIEEILIYKSASLDKGGIPFSALEYYYYVQINTKQNEEIIITCLMGYKVDEEIKKLSGVSTYRYKNPFFAIWKKRKN